MPEARAKARPRGGTKGKDRREKAAEAAQARQKTTRWWAGVAAAAAAIYLAFQVYAPALGGPFVFDDRLLPYYAQDFTGKLGAWLAGVRPTLMLSYWLNYQVSKGPFLFHVTNVLIHLVGSFLVFLIVRKLLRLARPEGAENDDLLAGFAGFVFLLHPIQTESVAYVAGRSESLSVMFFLAAFAVFLYRRAAEVSWSIAIAVLALFGAAVTSKEHTLVLPALLLLTDYYWNPGFSFAGIRRNWRIYAPIAVGGLAGGIFVTRILAGSETAGFRMEDFTWYQYFFTQCRAFFVYLRLFVFPVGQDLDWDYPISHTILEHGAIIGLLVIVLLIAGAIYYRRRLPLASYGFLAYVLLMAPTSSFVPIRDPLAERRLYMPMIGLLLVAVALLQRVHVDRRKLAVAGCAALAVLAFATYHRSEVWASDISLWEDTARESPGKARVHFQLAHTYYTHGRCRDAVNEYSETAKLQRPDYRLLVDWALAYDCADQPDQALAKLRQAAALNPTAHVYSQIGMVYAKRSQWPEALAALEQAEKRDPSYAEIYYYRGGIRAKTGDMQEAAADFRHALALDPKLEPAREGLNYVLTQIPAQR
ncbi:MAG TPA: tetratricopeptide repeat protein [Bryobacteraceae bacterium]|nr:tetratricopeptide repeat protein [Bryobacteraceae bacterium]